MQKVHQSTNPTPAVAAKRHEMANAYAQEANVRAKCKKFEAVATNHPAGSCGLVWPSMELMDQPN